MLVTETNESCQFNISIVLRVKSVSTYTRGLKLKFLWGPNEDAWSNLRATLWRWRNNGGTWTSLKTVFASYFLRKVSCVIGNSFLAVTTFVYKKLVHSLAEHFLTNVNKLNNLKLYFKIPKNYHGQHKIPLRAASLRPLT